MLQCLLWIITYTLTLISTIKYRYPTISPIAQVIIASFEFSVLTRFIIQGTLIFDYVSIAYIYWTLIELFIIIAIIKSGYFLKKHNIFYILSIMIMTSIMFYLVALKNHMFFSPTSTHLLVNFSGLHIF